MSRGRFAVCAPAVPTGRPGGAHWASMGLQHGQKLMDTATFAFPAACAWYSAGVCMEAVCCLRLRRAHWAPLKRPKGQKRLETATLTFPTPLRLIYCAGACLGCFAGWPSAVPNGHTEGAQWAEAFGCGSLGFTGPRRLLWRPGLSRGRFAVCAPAGPTGRPGGAHFCVMGIQKKK